VTDIATASHEVKNRLFLAAQTLFVSDADLWVSYGWPLEGRDRPDLMAFMDIRTEQSTATLGTNRSRDEDIWITLLVDTFRAGEANDDQVPTAAGIDYVRRLERHIRMTDPTLGGLAHHCMLDRLQTMAASDPKYVAAGRLVRIDCDFRARVRITG
jgi:hypothetical protein